MIYERYYKCSQCGKETTVRQEGVDNNGMPCDCGGAFYFSGESYDQEFVDQKRYEAEQDREYEERHSRSRER